MSMMFLLRRNRIELIRLMSCANLELWKWVPNTSFIQTNERDKSCLVGLLAPIVIQIKIIFQKRWL